MPRTDFNQLLEAGVHFGHLKRKWNPKMAPYIFMEKNGIHIIDLHKTVVKVDEAAAAEAAQSIQTLAAYTLAEAQIENMITAKGYTDCVVFMADDGVSVVVSAGEDGLQTEDIAKITDIVKQETELTADCIKILEVN